MAEHYKTAYRIMCVQVADVLFLILEGEEQVLTTKFSRRKSCQINGQSFFIYGRRSA